MVTVAQLVPQNIEKLPLWHWRPGRRVLLAGDRDGAAFDRSADADEPQGQDFQRELTADLLTTAQAQAGTDGVCAGWRFSLDHRAHMHLLLEHARGARVAISSGHGDPEVLAEVIGAVDAWVLLIGEGGPLDDLILDLGRHVEVLVGLEEGSELPRRAYHLAAAVHLAPRRTGAYAGEPLAALEQAARAQLPAGLQVYGAGDRHTHCQSCGRVLVWRYGGRSRIDELNEAGACSHCGTPSTIVP